MNIPTYFIGAILFLITQSATAIWWASNVSARLDHLEIEHDQIVKITEHLDVLEYKVDHIFKLMKNIVGKEGI
jgi:hypothetical protein